MSAAQLLLELADAVDKDRGHDASLLTRTMRDAAAELGRKDAALQWIAVSPDASSVKSDIARAALAGGEQDSSSEPGPGENAVSAGRAPAQAVKASCTDSTVAPGDSSVAGERDPSLPFCKGGTILGCEICVGSCGVEEYEASLAVAGEPAEPRESWSCSNMGFGIPAAPFLEQEPDE